MTVLDCDFMICDYQLSVEVQQDQGIRMRVALGVYIIADGVPGVLPASRGLPGAPGSTSDCGND